MDLKDIQKYTVSFQGTILLAEIKLYRIFLSLNIINLKSTISQINT